MIIMRYLKGIIIGFLCFIFLTLLAGLLLRFSPVPESWGRWIVLIALAVSCFLASVYISAGTAKAGIVTGLLTSAIIVVIIYLFVSILFDGKVNVMGLIDLYNLIPLVSGTIGGIVGINLKK